MKIDSSLLFSNCFGVFQGGGCRAIAYVGAYKKAFEHHIGFSDVAGTSAGAIFAALIAAGASPEKLERIASSKEIKEIPVESIGKGIYLTILFILIGVFFLLVGLFTK